jgi:soluble lytic murein transglycosylase-like protein
LGNLIPLVQEVLVRRVKLSRLENELHFPPSIILAVMGAESGYDPFIVSSKGAIGLMQIMPDTGARYGVGPFQLFNSETNIRIGTMELKRLFGKYDPIGAYASYNEGEGNYRKGYLPLETRGYIPRVLGFRVFFSRFVFP